MYQNSVMPYFGLMKPVPLIKLHYYLVILSVITSLWNNKIWGDI